MVKRIISNPGFAYLIICTSIRVLAIYPSILWLSISLLLRPLPLHAPRQLSQQQTRRGDPSKHQSYIYNARLSVLFLSTGRPIHPPGAKSQIVPLTTTTTQQPSTTNTTGGVQLCCSSTQNQRQQQQQQLALLFSLPSLATPVPSPPVFVHHQSPST